MDSTIRAVIDSLSSPEVLKVIRDKLITPAVEEALARQEFRHKREIEAMREYIAKQALRLNDLEQYSKKNSVIITCLPERENENVFGLTVEIARLVGVDVKFCDIDNAHRLGTTDVQSGTPRPIIVKFALYTKRSEFYAERKAMRQARIDADSCLTGDMIRNVYVSDCLTRHNSKVMYAARQLRRDNLIARTWSDGGKIKVRMAHDGPTKIVRCINDLKMLTGEHPALAVSDCTTLPDVISRPAPDAGLASAAEAYTAAVDRARSADAGGGSGGATPAGGADKATPAMTRSQNHYTSTPDGVQSRGTPLTGRGGGTGRGGNSGRGGGRGRRAR